MASHLNVKGLVCEIQKLVDDIKKYFFTIDNDLEPFSL